VKAPDPKSLSLHKLLAVIQFTRGSKSMAHYHIELLAELKARELAEDNTDAK
jgi:hypothetical protein